MERFQGSKIVKGSVGLNLESGTKLPQAPDQTFHNFRLQKALERYYYFV